LFGNVSEYHLVNSQICSYARDDIGYFDSVSKAFGEQNKGRECFESVNSRKRIDVGSLKSTAVCSIDGPLVSIIMTVYMENELLDAAINSVLKQTYRNIELIIVDDCSPDNVMQYLREKESLDDRIRVVSMKKNGGTYLAKNRGMTLAKGEFVAFHDSDDWLHPCKLEDSINTLQNDEQIVAVFSSYFRVDENGNILFRGIGAVRQACISLVMRREQVISTLGYFDNVRVSADSEYEYRLLAVFGKDRIEYLQEPYLIASVRSDSLSQGGKFAIGWSGLSGVRLEYRQAYTKWHESEHFSKNHYVSSEGNTPRHFPAPYEMF
jgi:glycosyltransferase involved in cell wall biosynthesis